MPQVPPDPANRLSELLDLVRAWQQDEDRHSRYSRPPTPSAVGALLWARLQAFVDEIQASPPSPDQGNALAQVFDQNLRASNATWTLLNALSSLSRAAGPQGSPSGDWVALLQETMMGLGCWPETTCALDAAGKPNGAYRRELDRATELGQEGVVRFLLAQPFPGTARREDLLSSRNTGTSSPFPQADMTGWIWAVRNTSVPCLEAWLSAGADPNAGDRAGRPALAYAHKPQQLHALLSAGADPLDPALPLDTRRHHLIALLKGWEMGLYHDAHRPPAEQEWADGLAYLRRRVAQWPREEAYAATDALAAYAYTYALKPGPHDQNAWARCLETLACELGNRPKPLPTDTIVIRNREYSFAALAALECLVKTTRSGIGDRLHKSCDPIDQALIALADLPLHVVGSRAVLNRLGPDTTAQALCLAMEEMSVRDMGWDNSLLRVRFEQVLSHATQAGPAWIIGMAPALDGCFNTLYGRWPSSRSQPFARNASLQKVQEWLVANATHFPPARRGRWALDAVAGYLEPSEPQPARADCVAVLFGSLAEGWSLDSLDPAGQATLGALRYRDKPLATALDSARAAHALDGTLAPSRPINTRTRM